MYYIDARCLLDVFRHVVDLGTILVSHHSAFCCSSVCSQNHPILDIMCSHYRSNLGDCVGVP